MLSVVYLSFDGVFNNLQSKSTIVKAHLRGFFVSSLYTSAHALFCNDTASFAVSSLDKEFSPFIPSI